MADFERQAFLNLLIKDAQEEKKLFEDN